MERKKIEQIQGRISRRRLVCNPTIQHVIINLNTKYDSSSLQGCGEIFDEKVLRNYGRTDGRKDSVNQYTPPLFQSGGIKMRNGRANSKRKIKTGRKEKERQYHLSMKELEMQDKVKSKPLDFGTHFDVTKHIRLDPPFQEKEVEKYSLHLEKVAENLNGPKEHWTLLLQIKVIGKTRETYT